MKLLLGFVVCICVFVLYDFTSDKAFGGLEYVNTSNYISKLMEIIILQSVYLVGSVFILIYMFFKSISLLRIVLASHSAPQS